MEKHKILIAGLPDTGKSTFIGALWAIVRNYSDVIKYKMKASDSDVPDLVEKLDNLSEAWECVRYIKRSSEDIPENMRIELVTADEEIGVTLDFPDFRGESFRNIISQNQPKTIHSPEPRLSSLPSSFPSKNRGRREHQEKIFFNKLIIFYPLSLSLFRIC